MRMGISKAAACDRQFHPCSAQYPLASQGIFLISYRRRAGTIPTWVFVYAYMYALCRHAIRDW